MKFINLYKALEMSPMFLLIKSAKIYSNTFFLEIAKELQTHQKLKAKSSPKYTLTVITWGRIYYRRWNYITYLQYFMQGFAELVKYILKNSSSFTIVINPYCPWQLSVINMIMFRDTVLWSKGPQTKS
jgi:hypothetical protein